jgi:hypothetical protein
MQNSAATKSSRFLLLARTHRAAEGKMESAKEGMAPSLRSLLPQVSIPLSNWFPFSVHPNEQHLLWVIDGHRPADPGCPLHT